VDAVTDHIKRPRAVSVPCKCDRKDLFNIGCQCGAFRAEQESRETPPPIDYSKEDLEIPF
jgi:hypothetical protein